MIEKIKTALSALLDAEQAAQSEPNTRITREINANLRQAEELISEALRAAQTHIRKK